MLGKQLERQVHLNGVFVLFPLAHFDSFVVQPQTLGAGGQQRDSNKRPSAALHSVCVREARQMVQRA